MSPIQWPRYLSDASFAASSLEVRSTSWSIGMAVKRHLGTPWHPVVVIACKDRGTLTKCSSARLRGWSGHVQASVKELNVPSRAINRMTSLRALSLSAWKAIWQMTLWPRSPHAHAGEANAMRATKSVRVTRCRNRVEW